ncbi:early nodule-specific protein 2-like [Alnus glutinosa]|uniref:early nodule-specific protein 2-like n=1 Tax=Alnus glutinosa TaxID=3517 RepID=UPI002D7A2C93|nr:early nodule-specific protein 2-like [Alnus glutinosa]
MSSIEDRAPGISGHESEMFVSPMPRLHQPPVPSHAGNQLTAPNNSINIRDPSDTETKNEYQILSGVLLGVVLLSSTASLADHHEPSKHDPKSLFHKPPSPPKHKPPTPLDHGDKPFLEHKPPLKGKGEKRSPEHKPPHEGHHERHLAKKPSLDGTPPKRLEKPPPPKYKPPISLIDKEEKPFPEHKPPPKGKGSEKPPHDHHPGRHLLESSFHEQNLPSLDGKPPKGKGEKPPPKHKPTSLPSPWTPFSGGCQSLPQHTSKVEASNHARKEAVEFPSQATPQTSISQLSTACLYMLEIIRAAAYVTFHFHVSHCSY